MSTPTLTDDDLGRLLGQAATSYDLPGPDVVDEAVQDAPEERVPLRERTALLWLVGSAAAVALCFGAAALPDLGGGDADRASLAEPTAVRDAGPRAYAGTAPAAAAAAGASGTAAADPAPATGVPADQGRVVKTGSISLAVADGAVPATLTAVQRIATAQAGIVFASTSSESGPRPTGQVTLRVPVARFEATVLAVRALGAEVTSADTRASDVTAKYADLQTQVRTLKATRERYLVILGQADAIGEILSVQQRVDAVSRQVDQLEGQLRVLADRSDLSTLVVSVAEKGSPEALAPAAREDDGIGAAWHDAVDGFTSGVEGLLARSGRALLVGLCLLVVWFAGLAGYRGVRRRLL